MMSNVAYIIANSGMTDIAFFEKAYTSVTKLRRNVTRDVLAYQVAGIVPYYVTEYIESLCRGPS